MKVKGQATQHPDLKRWTFSWWDGNERSGLNRIGHGKTLDEAIRTSEVPHRAEVIIEIGYYKTHVEELTRDDIAWLSGTGRFSQG